VQAGIRLAPGRIGTQSEGVKAAVPQPEQLLARHFAEGAQLTAVAIALAQQACREAAAAIGGGGEMHGDDSEVVDVVRNGFGGLACGQPHAQRPAVRILPLHEFAPAGVPHRNRHQQRSERQGHGFGRFVSGEDQEFPCVADDALLLEQTEH